MLDGGNALSTLLRDVSKCRECHIKHPSRVDHPYNFLVRPLPLQRLHNREAVGKYWIRVKRDDTFLRNLLEDGPHMSAFLERFGSARFSIGLLPWLDRCMLHREADSTAIMIIGIDFKNLPAFLQTNKDHHFPLDSYRTASNIWGPSWCRFWSNLFSCPYDDSAVTDFLRRRGAYFTNSVLCFGGAADPRAHCFDYLQCCRPHIERQIDIVRPDCLVSFGDFGCRNVAKILSRHNPNSDILRDLAATKSPLKLLRERGPSDHRRLLRVKYGSRELAFVPLYQPGWSHTAEYRRDYSQLRDYLELSV